MRPSCHGYFLTKSYKKLENTSRIQRSWLLVSTAKLISHIQFLDASSNWNIENPIFSATCFACSIELTIRRVFNYHNVMMSSGRQILIRGESTLQRFRLQTVSRKENNIISNGAYHANDRTKAAENIPSIKSVLFIRNTGTIHPTLAADSTLVSHNQFIEPLGHFN